MSTTIDQAFEQIFDSEVKLAYQQMGSKLRNTVRLKDSKGASTCRFQKLGKGVAAQKSRHGDVPIMNAVHTYVDATMGDWYAADLVDSLDEYKTNIDERAILANTAAYALGRKTDNLIITALTSGLASAQNITTTVQAEIQNTAGGKFVLDAALCVSKAFNDNDVPDDGQRYAIVNTKTWNNILSITQFTSSDYIGQQFPLLQGSQARNYNNIWWMPHTGLATSSSSTICIAYHRTAIGLGENAAINTMIERVALKDSLFIDSKMSAGAIRIDDNGVLRFDLTT